MRDLTRTVAEAHAAIEGRGAQPKRPTLLIRFGGHPETDVVSLPRAVAGGSLEGQILPAPPQIKATHRGFGIRPAAQHTRGNVQTRSQRGGIRRVPAGSNQGLHYA